MKNLLHNLAPPNTWVTFFASLAVVGVGCLLFGRVVDSPPLRTVGFWLLIPNLVVGMLLLLVVVPLIAMSRDRPPP